MTYTTVGPRAREVAEALLVAAEGLGLDASAVRTSTRGYIVPDAVAAEYERMLAGETEAVEEKVELSEEPVDVGEVDETATPNVTWKNDEIKTWAEARGVDLGGATKKADMLAAIQAADTEEG